MSIKISAVRLGADFFDSELTPTTTNDAAQQTNAQPAAEERQVSEQLEPNSPKGVSNEENPVLACPVHAVLVGPGQCACEDGYEIDEMGTACVLMETSHSLGHALATARMEAGAQLSP